jgi:hypothetical protein
MGRPRNVVEGKLYVLKDNAPDHYINGVVMKAGCKPFALPDGVIPGKFVIPVQPDDKQEK